MKNTGIDSKAKFKNSEANVSTISPIIADIRQIPNEPKI